VWWKFALSLVAIVGSAVLAAFAQIASIGASDSCNGCDTSPAWAKALWVAAGVAVVVWLVAAVVVAARATRARRAPSSWPR